MKGGEGAGCACACRLAPVASNSNGASRWAMAAAPRTLLVGIWRQQSRKRTWGAAFPDGLSVVHLLQNGGFDFPLHALAGGGQPVDADGAHAARGGVMDHQPGVELPRPAGGETEQQIESAVSDGVRSVDTLVADDEIAVAVIGCGERPLLRQHLEKRADQRPGTRPSRR